MTENKKILFEDFNKVYNKWVSGIAKRQAPDNVITVDDIVNKYRNNTDYEAPKELPYPLDRSVAMLGDIFSKLSEYKSLIHQSAQNPIISQNEKSVEQLKKVWLKVQTIQDILFSMTVNLNKIVSKEEKKENIDKEENESKLD
jgi:hypothetical protein